MEIEIGLPKDANERSKKRIFIPTLRPLETFSYKTRQRHICNCIINLGSWRRIRILTINPSAPHMVRVLGNANERYKKTLLRSGVVKTHISEEVDPIWPQVLLRSMNIT